MNEKQRIRAIRSGDTTAFGYFIDTYQDMAISIAFRICEDQPEAEDIAQNAFVKAFRNLHTFQGNSKFSTWFYRIVYNTAISEVRKAVHKTEFINYKHSELSHQYSNFDTLENLETEERKKIIEEALCQIPKNEAMALTLYYLEENSVKDVAEIMGLTVSNTKVKLHRGRKHLAIEIPREKVE